MLHLVSIFILASLVVLPVSAGYAADPVPPPPIEALKKEGAVLTYLGRDLGYDAWRATKDGQEQFFYVTPDGSAFFLGLLFNKNGRAVTFDQLKRLQGTPDPALTDLSNAPSQKSETMSMPKVQGQVSNLPKSELFFADVMRTSYFRMGKTGAKTIYTFIDPRCPHCKNFIGALLPELDKGTLAIEIIPVGALTPESPAMGAYLLNAPDAPGRMRRLMSGDDQAVPTDKGYDTSKVQANLDVMLKWQFDGTPVTTYRAKDGKIKILKGGNVDVKSILNDL
jgi:thiol:disulfide interchange protein DsbG